MTIQTVNGKYSGNVDQMINFIYYKHKLSLTEVKFVCYVTTI